MIGKWIGHYRLSGEVGLGGMGAVYQAVDKETGQLVAVKLLAPEYLDDLGLRAAFEREAQLVTSLTHEAIVPVYEFGQEEGQPYLVMQYMPNGSLADRLLNGVLAPEDLVPILIRLCRAIDYAHAQGIIHRDLKPSNILFDENDEAHLADFGIAWQTRSRPLYSPINGTPAYLSPEQALGEDEIDGRSDIYALGIILFETLTGRLPFDGQIPLAVIMKQIHDQAPSLREVDWGLPAALDEVIQRALAKNPSERFSTAWELVSAYQRALSDKAENQEAGTRSEHLPDRILDGSLDEQNTDSTSDSEILKVVPMARSGDEVLSPQPDGRQFDLIGNRQAPRPERWRLAHLLALGLVTVIGILMAAGLTAFLYLPQSEDLVLDEIVGYQLSFDRSSLILTNHSSEPLDLTDLSFQRIGAEGAPPIEFQATRWVDAMSGGLPTLQPGACFVLLLPDTASFPLQPGEPLPALPNCDNLQGWLIIAEPENWFWHSQGESSSFEVVLSGTVLQTCQIASGNCRFSIATP